MADILRVLDPGLLATVQDLGRTGYRRYGVSTAGAMDRLSLELANRLVGNERGEAAVEVTLDGGSFLLEAETCLVAVAGGDFPCTINGRLVPTDRTHRLERGDVLRLAPARTGMRAYLAVAGGFEITPMLGSRSTHVRSGLGGLDGGPLRAGDALPLRAIAIDSPRMQILPTHLRPAIDGPIRIVLGPQEDAFTDEALETLLTSAFVVAAVSDRMACQLDGPALQHASGFNIISDGVVAGSIQVPGHGRPIIMTADCQTTGGYPKIATVISPDLPKLAQRRPGDTVYFEAITPDEAERAAAQVRAQWVLLEEAIHAAPRQSPPLSLVRLLSENLTAGL